MPRLFFFFRKEGSDIKGSDTHKKEPSTRHFRLFSFSLCLPRSRTWDHRGSRRSSLSLCFPSCSLARSHSYDTSAASFAAAAAAAPAARPRPPRRRPRFGQTHLTWCAQSHTPLWLRRGRRLPHCPCTCTGRGPWAEAETEAVGGFTRSASHWATAPVPHPLRGRRPRKSCPTLRRRMWRGRWKGGRTRGIHLVTAERILTTLRSNNGERWTRR